jgi:LuxR family maltose regulon positive regulatory protein
VARRLAATGRVRQARALLSPLEEGPPSQAAAPAVRAELQLAEGDAAGAVATLAPCLAASAPSLMPYQRVEALLLDAVARLRLGHHDQAARSLEHALELAEPEGYRQVFWSLGEEVRALLLRQRDLGTAHPRLLDELLGGPAFDGPSTLAARVALPRFLTNHEEASLGFLDSSLNTPKITDELSTSINTVKSYLRRIYRELAASRANRRL